MLKILVVDDEEIIRNILLDMLSQDGHSVQTAVDGRDALEYLENDSWDLVLSDLTMPRLDGAALLKIIRERWPETLVIIITAYGSVDSAVSAMREGAYDYITKPFLIEEIRLRIRNILAMRSLSRENTALKHQLQEKYDFSAIIGKSNGILEVLEMIRRISIARSNVLILGESGTGKELVARAIHANSPCKSGPFLAINCGAIPENLLESELFGYKKGSFTGAYKDKTGLFASADEGSLFLDEIGEMPPGLQTKLLRALEERVIQPIGSTETLPFTARIIAATNKDLAREIGTGSFREDLYYRLNVVEIHVPPLRERQDDIPLLARHFVRKKAGEISIPEPEIDPAAMQALEEYSWKGNIRELENVIERAVILCDGNRIGTDSLPNHLRRLTQNQFPETGRETRKPPALPVREATGQNLKQAIADFERRYIEETVRDCADDKKEAALKLGISVASLYRKLNGEE
ncbi:MAG TPA: sigma-54 dependent transcriptional regulator [Spirochaetota bacterium]|nr:sigma-54 dependent transcriptional regulator [Spirochaetota bacterium]